MQPDGGDGRLARLGFTDVPAARSLLGPDGVLRLWDDGPVDEGAAHVVAALADAADPDLAVDALARIVAAVPRAQVLLAALRSSAGLRARLVGVCGISAPLGDFLAKYPTLWVDLADDAIMRSRPTAEGLRRTLIDAVIDAAEPLDALRVAYRSALVRLAARDVAEHLDVEDVAGELADLAAGTLDAAYVIATGASPDHSPPCRLAVIGMGKAGGRELNYVSDVDVVFVAEAVDGTDETAALRAATRVAEGVIRACSATTAEGSIWPVDAALRPEGKAGPLVRTLASHDAYYRRWAKTWEFQALLKARPVAGDRDLGREYVDRIAPLVWAAGERPDFVTDVQEMKRRVEASVSAAESGRQLKLGPGGLRDVEFAVQLLQLVHGRADESLRTGNTLEALARLAAGGYVATEDADSLAAAYRFLRGLEHRLQLQRLRRTHVIPTDAASLRWLARSVGLRASAAGDEVEQLRALHSKHAVEVRRLHEKLFYRPLLSTVARLPAEAIRLTPAAAHAWLEALGFSDAAGALRHIEAMTTGLSRRARVLRAMLPAMLPWFADAHDPDAGLLAFRSVSERLGDSPWFLTLLHDDAASAERLARLLSASRYVADLLGRAPDAVATLTRDDDLRPRRADALRLELIAVVARHDVPEEAAASVRALRRHELLRIASADLLRLVDVEEVGSALTHTAEATVAAALESAVRAVAASRGREIDCRLAVIGMGRLGGCEQGYGSDADVLFVHEPLPGVDDSTAAATAKEVAEELRRLLALPAPDPPLEVDAGLRPEGKQGPLSLSLAGYARYYERRVSVWEQQALLRARAIAGDADLGRRFEELIAPVRWPVEFGADAVREVRRIKARVESERLPRGIDRHRHTKLGPGGLADIEWTVQLLQLRHADALPGLRTTSTLRALEAAVSAELLAAVDADVLRDGWCAATQARNGLMLVRGRSSDVLPDDMRTLAGVARAVGYPAGSAGEFLEAYRRATRRSRQVVERVFYA